MKELKREKCENSCWQEIHQLIIEDVTVEDGGEYSWISTSAKLTVEGEDMVLILISSTDQRFTFCTVLFQKGSIHFVKFVTFIIIMSCRQHGYPWPSLATSPYVRFLGYILCPYIVAVKFVLVVLLLHNMWVSTGVSLMSSSLLFQVSRVPGSSIV